MTNQHTTADQLRDTLLAQFKALARYWADLPEISPVTGDKQTIHGRCEGVVFSILAELDGCGALPSFDLTAHVHPDNDDQTYEGVVISDMLHEHFFHYLEATK